TGRCQLDVAYDLVVGGIQDLRPARAAVDDDQAVVPGQIDEGMRDLDTDAVERALMLAGLQVEQLHRAVILRRQKQPVALDVYAEVVEVAGIAGVPVGAVSDQRRGWVGVRRGHRWSRAALVGPDQL